MTGFGEFDPVGRLAPEWKFLSQPAVRHNVSASAMVARCCLSDAGQAIPIVSA